MFGDWEMKPNITMLRGYKDGSLMKLSFGSVGIEVPELKYLGVVYHATVDERSVNNASSQIGALRTIMLPAPLRSTIGYQAQVDWSKSCTCRVRFS